MRTGRWWVLVWLWLVPTLLQAQSDAPDVLAELSEQTIYEGEQVRLNLILRGEEIGSTRLPRLPEIPGLQLITPTPSRSQRISIVNGVTTAELRFSWNLVATEVGAGSVPPITIEMDGERYSSEPLDFEVIQQTATPSSDRRPDLFAEMEIDDTTPYVGQQLIASLVIYFREGLEITSWQPAVGWRTDGFWREDLENSRQPEVETVLLEGVRYRRARLLQFSLFPTRPGDVVLQPFELHLGVRTPARRNDPFGSIFGGLGSNQRRFTLETDAMELTVQRPDTVQNALSLQAVGDLQVERQWSRSTLQSGESVELITTLRGEGNLPLITRPEYDLPDSFERYAPTEETELDRRNGRISGTRTFRQQIIPRSPGTWNLEPVRIAVFDPRSGEYRYQTLPELELHVERSTTLADTGAEISSSDFTPHTGLVRWERTRPNGWGSRWILLFLLVPVLVWWSGNRYVKYRQRLHTDDRFARSHYAWDRVEERLIEAEEAADQGDATLACKHLHHALSGYISDRTGLPPAGLSDRQLVQEVRERSGNDELATRLSRLLDRFVSIGYAPTSLQSHLDRECIQTRELLKELRRNL